MELLSVISTRAMPLNHRQLTQRVQETGRAYRNYRNYRDLYGRWGHEKKRRDAARKFNTIQQRIVRLVQILQAQKRRQYLKQTARARKVRREKLWLKRHGHMMFKSLGKRKR